MSRRIDQLFFNAMQASSEAIEWAKKEGNKLSNRENQYKECVTVADEYIGKAVSSVLEKSGIPIGLVQEEREGIITFNGNSPEYLFVLDEQDGYGLSLIKGVPHHIRYGTIAAILEGDNPKWSDVIVGGTFEHWPKKRLVYGSKDEGKSYLLKKIRDFLKSEGFKIEDNLIDDNHEIVVRNGR